MWRTWRGRGRRVRACPLPLSSPVGDMGRESTALSVLAISHAFPCSRPWRHGAFTDVLGCKFDCTVPTNRALTVNDDNEHADDARHISACMLCIKGVAS